jgi:hypothetical protein
VKLMWAHAVTREAPLRGPGWDARVRSGGRPGWAAQGLKDSQSVFNDVSASTEADNICT